MVTTNTDPVSTNNKSDEQLHRDIRDAIFAVAGGGSATFLPRAACRNSADGQDFDGSCVRIDTSRPTGVVRVRSTGGSEVTHETNATSFRIPTLNTWGIVLLASLALFFGVWYLRRRQGIQEA